MGLFFDAKFIFLQFILSFIGLVVGNQTAIRRESYIAFFLNLLLLISLECVTFAFRDQRTLRLMRWVIYFEFVSPLLGICVKLLLSNPTHDIIWFSLLFVIPSFLGFCDIFFSVLIIFIYDIV
jgi:hypothetical protein